MTEPLELIEWDQKVRYHLSMITAGADVIERHIRDLVGKPDFYTMAENDLDKQILALTDILKRLEKAKQEYHNKPVVT